MINGKELHGADMVFLKPIPVFAELRKDDKILMKMIGFFDKVPSVRDGICFFAPYFARYFMSVILTPMGHEGIPSLKECL
jgi:hypothetical protein